MKDTNEQCQKSADNFEILYGKEKVNLQLDADLIDIKSDRPPLSEEEIFRNLEEDAIYSYSLNETITDAEKILIILPDTTRKSGAEQVLPKMIEEIERQGKEFHFIIAIGTHRKHTAEEDKKVLTPEIYEKHSDKIIVHDCEDYDAHDFYGITKKKTTVLINKAYREHDTIITIGSVSYHYFAGYGGGRKLIVPGIASKKTIMANHKLALDPVLKSRHEKSTTGNLKHNPVHDDLVECIMIARSAHTFFAVNTIINNEGKICALTCGDLFMSHIKAAELLDEFSEVKPDKKYDLLILSAGGYPKDINMVQAQKSLDRIVPLLDDNAKVIFFAQCPDGYGNSYFKEFFDKESASEMLDDLIIEYQINRQTAYNLKTRLEAFDVYLKSDFDEKDASRMGFKVLKDKEQVYELAEKADNIAVVPFAYNILPK
jgi:nickel-dependent lactate racemase